MVISAVKSAKSLGVTLDDELKLVKNIATVCHLSYCQIWAAEAYLTAPGLLTLTQH